MSRHVGQSVKRVDAFDKATGRAKYTDDLCAKDALIVKVVRSTVAHGFVKSIDISEAEKIPGVVKILTCFDVPDIQFPTAGHPWSTDPSHQDTADRNGPDRGEKTIANRISQDDQAYRVIRSCNEDKDHHMIDLS